jgi:HEAT repeat protein
VSALYNATHDFDLVVPYWLLATVAYEQAQGPDRLKQQADQEPAEEINMAAISAAFALRHHGKKTPQELGKCLIKLLSDKSPDIRRAAARNLGAIADDNAKSKKVLHDLNAYDAVSKLLDDSDASVRLAAETALEKLEK